MERGEYWILDSVVKAMYTLHLLVSKDIEMYFNREGHGLDWPNLVNTLERLFQSGDLIAQRVVNHESFGKEFTPTSSEIEKALGGELKLYYGLTTKGGARWEAYSQPDWEHYIDARFGIDPNQGCVTAMNRKLVGEYISLMHYKEPYTIIKDTGEWTELVPWNATYWKELPRGHQLCFQYEYSEARIDYALTEELEGSPGYETVPPQVKEWFRRTDKWYTNYLEK